MTATIAAAPYEHPKLAVTAVVDGGSDFAARLELARARSAKVIDRRAEARPIPPPVGRQPTPMGAPMARLRRI
jgi:hypothetical protein